MKKGAGIDVSGNITGYMHDIFYFDFHKYLRDSSPFDAELLGWEDHTDVSKKVTDDEEVFRNPWMSLSQATIEVDRQDYPDALNDSKRIWLDPDNVYDHTLLLCNTTGTQPPFVTRC